MMTVTLLYLSWDRQAAKAATSFQQHQQWHQEQYGQ
jgi:hypothetical protein